jgi:hypothetical protein
MGAKISRPMRSVAGDGLHGVAGVEHALRDQAEVRVVGSIGGNEQSGDVDTTARLTVTAIKEPDGHSPPVPAHVRVHGRLAELA